MNQSLHIHTTFSDGSAEPQKYVEAAIARGLSSIGFSDHSPLPFENTFALPEEKVGEYCETVRSLKEATRLPVYPLTRLPAYPFTSFLGMEADYIPGMGLSFDHLRESCSLDYLIGAVHLVRNGDREDLWFIDGPDPATYTEGLDRLFKGDIRKGVTAYYRQVNEMLTTGGIDVIGHLDKIKMHNHDRFFRETEPWYMALVDETLELVRQTGVIAEVNTRGIYKKRCDSLFPGPAILKKIHALRIPVIITSDAHRPEEVSMLFEETAGFLKEIGFMEVMELTTTGWETRPL